MIFVDSNIPMYVVGAEHPNKARTLEMLKRLIASRERFVTGVEVFQEILHRYSGIQRREAIQPAWTTLAGIVDEVLPLNLEDVEHARDLVLEYGKLSARDALHTSVMRRHDIRRIFSFDGGFDAVPGIVRIQ